jgi:hypothetical protein
MHHFKTKLILAVFVLVPIAIACAAERDDSVSNGEFHENEVAKAIEPATTQTCTPSTPSGFKSRVIPQFYTSDQATCLNKYGPVNPNGKRPACAVTSWNSATQLCSITGVKPGCACYEGQAHACDLGAAGSPASPCTSGTNCGVVTCNVVSDTSSTWNGCTSLCSCQ